VPSFRACPYFPEQPCFRNSPVSGTGHKTCFGYFSEKCSREVETAQFLICKKWKQGVFSMDGAARKPLSSQHFCDAETTSTEPTPIALFHCRTVGGAVFRVAAPPRGGWHALCKATRRGGVGTPNWGDFAARPRLRHRGPCPPRAQKERLATKTSRPNPRGASMGRFRRRHGR